MGGVCCSKPGKWVLTGPGELARRGWIDKGDQIIRTHTAPEPTQVIRRGTARKYEDLSPQKSGQHLIPLVEQNVFE